MPDGIAAVGTVPGMGGGHAGTETALHALSGIGSDGFLRLLVAQLRYQSPLEPSDPGDMMLQTAQLAQLDATQQLLSLQQRDFGLQQAVLAASMVGAEVTASGIDGMPVHGTVDAVRYTVAGPVLVVGQQEVTLGAVTEIRRNGVAADTLPVPGSLGVPPTSDPVPVSSTAPVSSPVVSNDTSTSPSGDAGASSGAGISGTPPLTNGETSAAGDTTTSSPHPSDPASGSLEVPGSDHLVTEDVVVAAPVADPDTDTDVGDTDAAALGTATDAADGVVTDA